MNSQAAALGRGVLLKENCKVDKSFKILYLFLPVLSDNHTELGGAPRSYTPALTGNERMLVFYNNPVFKYKKASAYDNIVLTQLV